MSNFGAVILAAGLSSRMVENKILLPWRDGQRRWWRMWRRSSFKSASSDVVVVTGRDAVLVREAVAALDVRCVHNPDYATGEMLSSVKVGLRALSSDLRAAFIQPADMPCVPVAVIQQLAEQHEPGWNVAPQFQGRRGHPVLLDRAYRSAMLGLSAGSLPREALRGSRLRLLDVEAEGVLLDVDTRAAYERALERGTQGSGERKRLQ